MDSKIKLILLKSTCLFVSVGLALNTYAQNLDRSATATPGNLSDATSTSAALFSSALERVAAQDLRVVYLGADNLRRQLPYDTGADSTLDPNSSKQVVIVDSANQDQDMYMRLLAKGNIIISVGNTPIDSSRSALSTLMDIGHNGKMMNSKAYHDANQPEFTVQTDEGVQRQVLSAHFYSPDGAQSYFSAERDQVLAMANALNWARDIASTKASSSSSKAYVLSKSTSWGAYHTYSSDHDCGDRGGNLNMRVYIDKLSNDGSSSNDFFTIKYQGQILPKIRYAGGFYTHRWHNADLGIIGDVDVYNQNARLITYDPTTTQGATSATVSLDGSTGAISINRSWTYTVTDITIADGGDLSRQVVSWYHDINERRSVGTSTVLIAPGAMFSTNNGGNGSLQYIRFIPRWRWAGNTGGSTASSNCQVGWG